MVMGALRGSSGSGSVQAGLVVRFDFHDAVAARITNEFLDASTLVSFDTVPVMAGPGNQPRRYGGDLRPKASGCNRTWVAGIE
jgi:hypothetical protein